MCVCVCVCASSKLVLLKVRYFYSYEAVWGGWERAGASDGRRQVFAAPFVAHFKSDSPSKHHGYRKNVTDS